MDTDTAIIEIIILAMIALFIGLRLRSVLGKHRPDEPPGAQGGGFKGNAPQKKRETVDPGAALGFGRATFKNTPAGEKLDGEDNPIIRKIFKTQGQAGYAKFIDGAKNAYRMTLEGFWAGKMGEMEPYIDPDVLRGFKSAIDQREKQGHKVENRLIEILETKLDDAGIYDSRAEITLRFKSEIVAVLRDKNGKLLEGNVSDTIKVTDIWTFARNLKSRDPNWVLVATESA